MSANAPRKSKSTALVWALACGGTVEYAADHAGVSRRTAFRRLADPEFRRQVAEARTQMVERASGSLTAVSAAAIATLNELLDRGIAPQARLGAARAVLDIGMKVREVAELEQRIAELEQRIAGLD
jgi:hypothetical protein